MEKPFEIEPSIVLKRAAEDSALAFVYNIDRLPGIRPSRAGLPLIQLVLEDLVIPKLEPVGCNNNSYRRDTITKVMSLALGHMYEKAVEAFLLHQFTDTQYQVLTQENISVANMQGSCDLLLINHVDKAATVIECKALKGYSETEVKEQKLLCDNWGYFTQLSLYALGIGLKYPGYKVDAHWRVWIKQLEKEFTLPLPVSDEELLDINNEVLLKSEHYANFQHFFQHGNLEFAVNELMHNTEDLPVKINKGTYYASSCGFHFSPYAKLLTNKDGTLVDSAGEIVLQMCKAARFGFDSEHQRKLTAMLDKVK